MSEDGKAFGQGILSVITNHIYWLAMLNFYFIVCNLLFLAIFLFLVPSFSNMVLYFLALHSDRTGNHRFVLLFK